MGIAQDLITANNQLLFVYNFVAYTGSAIISFWSGYEIGKQNTREKKDFDEMRTKYDSCCEISREELESMQKRLRVYGKGFHFWKTRRDMREMRKSIEEKLVL